MPFGGIVQQRVGTRFAHAEIDIDMSARSKRWQLSPIGILKFNAANARCYRINARHL